MKKSLIFWFAAITCAALVLIGCPTEAETETKYVTQTEVIQEKYVITSGEGAEAALTGYLAEGGDFAVGIYEDVSLTGDLTVPAGKIIQLHGATTFDAASSALTVNGKVYVYHEATLKAEGAGKVVIPGSGSVIVRQDGILSVDSADDVNDGATPTPATVLGTAKVSFTETSVLKASTGTSVAAIKEVLDLVTVGIVDASASTAVGALKPSAISTTFTEPIGAEQKLLVTTNTADGEATSLTVPAGIELTTNVAYASTLLTLTVNGTLTAESGTFDAVTTLTVNGTLTSIGTFDALTTVAGTGSVTAAVVTAGTAKFLIESTLTEVTLGSTTITDDDLVIPANTVRVFTAAAAPSAAVTVNGTAIFSGAAAPVGDVTVNGTVVVDGSGSLAIAASETLTVAAGAELVADGDVTIGSGGSLVLTGAAGSGGAKLSGAGEVALGYGKITGGASGAWQAVGANTTIAFAGATTTASITGTGTGPVLAGLAHDSAVITLAKGSTNGDGIDLTVNNATIDLTANGAVVFLWVGTTPATLVLKGGTGTEGKLKLGTGAVTNTNAYLTNGGHSVAITGSSPVIQGVTNTDGAAAGLISGGAVASTNDATITGKTATDDVTITAGATLASSGT
ncbi:MAG: hypothetical protein LBF83_07450 [Spirochaetaceae bacterium]|jgi:hypothetical protein|nr:hypothetical protein [Spirochaetaceae bacterium]